MPSRRKTNSFPIFVLIGGGLLLILAAILLFNQNTSAPSPEAAVEEGIPYPEIARVSIEDAKAAFESGSAILLDVRSAEAYAGSHIRVLSTSRSRNWNRALANSTPIQWIITYCT